MCTRSGSLRVASMGGAHHRNAFVAPSGHSSINCSPCEIWLVTAGVTDVAMESTGVYWMPVYRVLEGHVRIILGNARLMANVPGRKTDDSDAEWIAVLLRHGLIRPSFVPPKAIRELRQLTRCRS